MGTYGALLNAKKKLNNFFFLFNGDTYFNVNLRDFQKKNIIQSIFALLHYQSKKIYQDILQLKKIKLVQ